MDVTRPIDTLDETFEHVCLWWSADEEVDYSLRQSTGNLDQGGLDVV